MIKVDLDTGDDRELTELTPPELGAAMAPEIRKFDQWFQSKGNGPLVSAEAAILKTYLGWKIVFDGKD